MENQKSYFSKVLKPKLSIILTWMVLLIIYHAIFRGLFVYQYFGISSIDDKQIWLNGFRFDLSAIFLLNSIFFISLLLPIDFGRFFNWWKNALLITNALFWALNLGDIPFYAFTQKRFQADIFQFFTGEKQTDIGNLLPIMLKENFNFVVVWLIMVLLAIYVLRRFKLFYNAIERKSIVLFGLSFFCFTLISVLCIRGGIQLRPLNPIHANDVDTDKAPAVLNSTFTILRSAGKKELPDVDTTFFKNLTNDEKGIKKTSQQEYCINGSNVVIIIVESLSWEYLSKYGGTGSTPFIDSLIDHSRVYTRAYANARESVQGIPAILASIPAWHDEAFIFSKYNNNHFNSLASLLHHEGYTSAFIHGAKRGSMGFESFARLSKFDQYHGREDYNNDSHYDGTWGIWDHHMLDYTAKVIDTIKEPFLISYFTLNPHHPFKIPEPWNSKYRKDKKHPILRSLKYIDASLHSFFEQVKDSPWYENTLFVITADHIGPVTSVMHTKADDYHVPLIIFHPGHTELKGKDDRVVSQIDIMPSVLDLLEYPNQFFSLGNSFFSLSNDIRYNLNYREHLTMYLDSNNYGIYNEERCISSFDTSKDRLLRQNLAKLPSMTDKLNIHRERLMFSKKLYYHTMKNDLMSVRVGN